MLMSLQQLLFVSMNTYEEEDPHHDVWDFLRVSKAKGGLVTSSIIDDEQQQARKEAKQEGIRVLI